MDFGLEGFGFEGFGMEENGNASTGNEGTTVETTSGGFGMDDWGESLASFFDTPTKKKPAKAESKKEDAKKDASKSAKKNGKDEDVELPVTVVGRGFKTPIAGNGSMKLSAIGKKLIEDGYKQFLIPGMALTYESASKTVYVVDGGVKAADKDTAVDLSDGKSVTVIDGQLAATFTADDFEDKEVDEITALDVAERFATINPAYTGCGISYVPGCDYCYPVFDTYEFATSIQLPAKILVGGEWNEYEDEKITDAKSLKEVAFGNFSKGMSVNLGITSTKSEYVAVFTNYGAYTVTAVSVGGSSGKAKKVEQKYSLPMELYIVTFNCLYKLTSEQFGGKDKVTLEEIKEHMSKEQKMFADKSRKIDTLYNKEMNRLAVMFVSGTKGCELIRTEEEFEQCKEKEQFHGVYVTGNGAIKLRALPHGNFFSHMGKAEQCNILMHVSFERKLPKVPGSMLYEIMEYFREDLTREAMVRIVYDKEKEEFAFYKADGEKSKARIFYEFNVDESFFNPNKVQVMEVHSHNTMPAFFSSIDDADEADYPGVFGVIGNLDRQTPSMLFRAGVDGMFKALDCSELFDL